VVEISNARSELTAAGLLSKLMINQGRGAEATPKVVNERAKRNDIHQPSLTQGGFQPSNLPIIGKKKN
jgi:hypothetical protein